MRECSLAGPTIGSLGGRPLKKHEVGVGCRRGLRARRRRAGAGGRSEASRGRGRLWEGPE